MVITPVTLIAGFVILFGFCLVGISMHYKRRFRREMRAHGTIRQLFENDAEFLNIASEATQTGIWEYRSKEEKVLLSEQWFRVLGYSQKNTETTIEGTLNYIHPEDRALVVDYFKKYKEGQGKEAYEKEIRLLRKDGTPCWFLSKGKTVSWDDAGMPVRMIGLNVNIDSLKKARVDLEKSQTKFRLMFEHTPYPASIVHFETGVFLEANRAFFDFHGIEREDLSRYSVMDLSTIDTEENQTILDALETDGVIKNQETEIIRKDGARAHVLFSSVLIDVDGEKQVLSVTLDITERKRAEEEREKFRERIHHSQKLEAVGILAGGVAHDFNNMLGAIIGYTELTMGQMDPGEPNRKNLNVVLDSAHRSVNLVRQLLAFARKQTVEPIVFDLNLSVEDILKMIRRLIGENVELVWTPGNSAMNVLMDPSHFDQIMVNLCVNARDAITDVGRVIIETAAVAVDDTFPGLPPEMPPGTFARLTIRDNGAGMTPETVSQIFQPFFTTKGVGQGTGMGLATVYGIVRQNNGFITVDSELHKGSVFSVYMPLHASACTVEKPLSLEDVPKSRGETILLVEDDPSLLELNVLMLQKMNYQVLSAETPGEAIEIAENETGEIHLLITDVIMPEMNGKNVADQIQQIKPGIKVLFMSGYTADVIGHKGVLDNGVHFIQKPFSIKKIGQKIRRVLD